MGTSRGRMVRADYRMVESAAPRLCRWAQEVAGTPFERVLASAETEVRLEPGDDGTRVTLTRVQRMRGMARLGSLMLRRATRGQLDEALDGLRGLVEPA